MRSTRKILWAILFLMPLLVIFSISSVWGQNVPDDIADDELNEVTARVARISFIKGDAQIRRADNEDWEKVTKNLPIVEGDEIATEKDTRIEIQFDTYKYLRLAEKAFLKITTLRDEGIAVSLPEGSLNLRVLKFDKKDEFFEIDAPQTTIAVQKSGMYRVDAGDNNYTVVQINVTEGGTAQVYSLNAGFMLRDGRRARVFTEGQYAGEWDLDDASRNMDEFDNWSLERDEMIAERLRKSHYDKYYDRDIYGAEDLNDAGEWIYTRDYGYVWRPYKSSIDDYADWSPYRYGQWRWLPAFGWTWVNYEPWGWATYHYGRWVFHDGFWVWTPYSKYRPRRSWWRPALVIIASIGRDIYWCPLPYDYGYYGYNRRHRRYHNNNGNSGGPTPTPTPTVTPTPGGGRLIRPNDGTGRVFGIGQTRGVIRVPASEFGRGNEMFRVAPTDIAREVLSRTQDEVRTPPILPTYRDLNGNVSKDILIKDRTYTKTKPDVKTGAKDREIGVSLDETLRKERVYGNRAPVGGNTNTETRSDDDSGRRGTGAVNRSPGIISTQNRDEKSDDGSTANQQKRRVETNQSPPIYSPPTRTDTKREEPKYEPPPKREEPKYEPPPRREEPKYEPPPRREEPKYEPPPPRQEPKYEPPPQTKSDPPPTKSEPPPSKSEDPPSPSKKGRPVF